MTSFKVKASILNVRTAPVEDFTGKNNVIAKLFKDAPFESVNEKTNKLGAWYQDVNNHWVWGGGLLDNLSDNKTTFDFQNFINACYDDNSDKRGSTGEGDKLLLCRSEWAPLSWARP